jgi:hypothetical protein
VSFLCSLKVIHKLRITGYAQVIHVIKTALIIIEKGYKCKQKMGFFSPEKASPLGAVSRVNAQLPLLFFAHRHVIDNMPKKFLWPFTKPLALANNKLR